MAAINLEVWEEGYGVRTDIKSDLTSNALEELIRRGRVPADEVRAIVADKSSQLSEPIYFGQYVISHSVSNEVAHREFRRAQMDIKIGIDSAEGYLNEVDKSRGRKGLFNRVMTKVRRIFNG